MLWKGVEYAFFLALYQEGRDDDDHDLQKDDEDRIEQGGDET